MLANRTTNLAQLFSFSRKLLFSTSPALRESAEPAEEDERKIDPAKDRRNPVSVETSIKYLESKAFQETYQGNAVWSLYRRNFKGQFAPHFTRKTCIRAGEISTGNPCPICRDEYLVLDYRNVKLLQQFISPHNGEVLSFTKTGICQKRHRELLVAILKAKNYGYITFDVPFREYDYSVYTKRASS